MVKVKYGFYQEMFFKTKEDEFESKNFSTLLKDIEKKYSKVPKYKYAMQVTLYKLNNKRMLSELNKNDLETKLAEDDEVELIAMISGG